MKVAACLISVFLVLLTNCVLASDATPGFKIESLAERVYLHTSYKNIKGYGVLDSNGLIVLDGKDAYLIDTPWSETDTEKLLSWIDENNFSLKASVSTHWHDDRTAGIALLNKKQIPTYASMLTNQSLQTRGKPKAMHTFDATHYSLLPNKIEIFYPGPGHSEDNIVVWLPHQKILFGGCLLRALAWTSPGNLSDANLDEWAHTVNKIKERYKDIDLVVPGHGNVTNAQILDHTINVVEAARKKR